MFCNKACVMKFSGETLPEATVREALTTAGVSFRQEVAIGVWAADFLVGDKLILEVDGDYWHSTPQAQERDRRRDAALSARGFETWRITESAVKTPELLRQFVDRVVAVGTASQNAATLGTAA